MKIGSGMVNAKILVAVTAIATFACSASAQIYAYDDAGNYLINANWTNGANQGFGFTPWKMVTGGPNSHGNYVGTANNPMFVIASVANVSSVNYRSEERRVGKE